MLLCLEEQCADQAAQLVGVGGARSGAPFPIPAVWISTFLERDPSFDTSARTDARFADDPDLAAFREAGGKLLTFHGSAEQLIPTQGTVDYRRRVQRLMGGSDEVDTFYRLFPAPCVGHCGGGGTGPVPTDPLAALTDWVENGKALDTLPAGVTDAAGKTVTRDLCRYPLISTYSGHGDRNAAGSYRCTAGSEADDPSPEYLLTGLRRQRRGRRRYGQRSSRTGRRWKRHNPPAHGSRGGRPPRERHPHHPPCRPSFTQPTELKFMSGRRLSLSSWPDNDVGQPSADHDA
ncbi:tannase/feruloyl esterase family alpha/beta hydrolase [Streptomyces tendae]